MHFSNFLQWKVLCQCEWEFKIQIDTSICWNSTKSVTDGSHKCSQRNRKNVAYKLFRIYWTWRWSFPQLHHYHCQDIISSLKAGVKMAIYGVATCECPIEEKSLDEALSGLSDVCCLLDTKGAILLDFLEPRQSITLTTMSGHWLSRKHKLPEPGQRRRQPVSSCMIIPGSIPVWRSWSILPTLARWS